MSKTIDTLLSPLIADEKQKAAIVALALLMVMIDKSIAHEEIEHLNIILEKNKFGNNLEFAKFIAATKFAIQETYSDPQNQNKFIQDCAKNIFDKHFKDEVLTMIKEISAANKKITASEIALIEKVRSFFVSN